MNPVWRSIYHISFCLVPSDRNMIWEGWGDYMPVHYSQVPLYAPACPAGTGCVLCHCPLWMNMDILSFERLLI